ncbi:MAG: polysaccharide deacetylase family protein [Polaromonas sp.]|nr:polysaccharide deacetylase family protein [Polaromonas sp.]
MKLSSSLLAISLIASCAHECWAAGTIDAKNQPKTASGACKPVYLTLDTGHMEVAPLMADILNKHQVKVTFFAANERTKTGDGSLGNDWAPWWKARAAEGHEFASHTFDHTYWRGDVVGRRDGPPQARPAPSTNDRGSAPPKEHEVVSVGVGVNSPSFKIRPSAGPSEGKDFTWTAKQYCEEVGKSSTRLEAITGKKPLPLFRAPGGKTSPALLAAAKSCGYEHVGWSPAGFLGDELPSDKFPNDALLKKALQGIQAGDILLAHLGIWSRKDPWAPAVLEPLITTLQSRGFCFKTLREHPQYKAWIDSRMGAATPAPAK